MTAVFEDENPPDQAWLSNPPSVAAVLVAHNGARWLPQTLQALGTQTHHASHGMAVHVTSTDETPEILARTFHESAIVEVPAGTGFGDAVRAGLDSLARTEWIWLLHDDCAPAPDALERLLDEAIASGADVVGPKVREWPTLRRLLEVGVSITGTGHRETGLERGEPDQGQHDRARDVLAVSSAGMLVKREMWDALNGFDPELPLYFDDVDFGWRVARHGGRTRVVPRSVMFHAEASARSQRPTARRVHPRPRRDARKGALFTLLSNASLPGFCWQFLRLFVGTVLRSIGLVLVKAPGDAQQEIAALISVYARPWRILAARRRRAATSTVSAADVRHLLPSWSIPYRHGVDEIGDVIWGLTRTPDADASGRRAAVVEYSHVADLDDEAEPDRGIVAFARRHPWAGVVAVLSLASLVACWGLIGSGLLSGGALLPAPDSTGAWWSTFAASWHDVGLGSDRFGPPYAFVLALLSVFTFGHPGLVIDVVVIGAVPLAAVTAHRLARRFLQSGWLQAAWAVAYAFAVVASGALGQGRFGSLLGLVLAPVIVNAGISLVQRSSLRRGWQEGLRVGLWLSALTAFVPIAYVVTICGLLIAVGLRGHAREWLSLALAAVVPFGVLGPWMWERALDPRMWWWEAGLADGGFGSLEPDALDVALGQAGGPYSAPALFGIGLLIVGVAALIPGRRRTAVLWAWLIGLLCLAFAVIGAGTTFEVPGVSGEASAWIGFVTVCWLSALGAAGAIALDGMQSDDRRALGRTLGVAGLVVGLSAPVLMGAWWLVNADGGAVDRGDASDLPAFVSAAAADSGGSVVVLDGADGDALSYHVHTDDGPRLGDESVLPDADDHPDFAPLIAALASDPTQAEVDELADYGVQGFFARPPVDESLTVAFDSAPGFEVFGSSVPDSRVWMLKSRPDPSDGDGSALRPWMVAGQLVVLVVVLVVATPGRRSRRRA
ncbi:glycosyltransferase family 2 protein [Nocardioidaceae bacterium SCSIO 66511]|nr:glycosyltransferase family 2 protein [Nocardioidaceae bacterium SCSIO 66511]